MRNMEKMAWLALALALLALPAGAGDDLMSSQLVDQARHWQQKNRDDIAAELWSKLLRANPTHAEALVQLGAIEARAGHLNEAEALYSRASRLAPPPAGLKELSIAIRTAKGTTQDLPPAPVKPEPRKPAPETAKTGVEKRPETRIVNPPASKPQKTAPVKLPASKASAAGANEGRIITETDDLRLKPSTSLDLLRVKPRP